VLYLKFYHLFSCLLFAVSPLTLSAQPVTVVDDVGNRITLAQPAQRIVSLSPHLTELLFAAGAGDKVVGVVEFSDYPEAARHIKRIGSAMSLDMEGLMALQPDLVVAWESGNSRAMLEKIDSLGYTVYRSEPRQLEDIAANIKALAQLAGSEKQAAPVVADYLAELKRLRQQNSGKSRISVFYQIWNQPLMTINGEHLISKVIELCGGENIFAGLSGLAPQVSLEAVLLKKPDVILIGDRNGERQKWLNFWQAWDDIPAVKKGNIYVIHPDLIQRHTPRILQGAALVCGYLDKARQKTTN
jgi:iron complex transport system substrate-binding protein